MDISRRWVLLGAGVATATAAIGGWLNSNRPTADVEIAWIQIIPEGADGKFKPLLRVVLAGAGTSCPGVNLEGNNIESFSPDIIPRDHSLGDDFQVTVCQYTLPFPSNADQLVIDGGPTLRVPALLRGNEPAHIIVVGDTGCRGQHPNDAADAQHCEHAWHFREVATAAGKIPSSDRRTLRPDLVIHVGDYIYGSNDETPILTQKDKDRIKKR